MMLAQLQFATSHFPPAPGFVRMTSFCRDLPFTALPSWQGMHEEQTHVSTAGLG